MNRTQLLGALIGLVAALVASATVAHASEDPDSCYLVSAIDMPDQQVEGMYDAGYWYSYDFGGPYTLPDAIAAPGCVMDDATLAKTPPMTIQRFNALSDTNRAKLSYYQHPPPGWDFTEDYSVVRDSFWPQTPFLS